MRPIHHWTDLHRQRLETIIRDKTLTVTITESVAIVGFPQYPLLMKLKELGLKTRGRRGPIPSAKPTPDMLAPYVELARLTVPLARVARETGCSYAALNALRRSLGIATKQKPKFIWTPERTAHLRSFIDTDGHLTTSVSDAAHRLGCDTHALSRKLWLTKRKAQP